MGCCEAAKWQREEYPDHKFDYIDLDDHIDDSWTRKLQYSFIFFLTVKSVLVYTADIALLALLITNGALDPGFKCPANMTTVDLTAITGVVCNKLNEGSVSHQIAPAAARPWIMLASIVMSLALLAWDYRKGFHVVKSRDIARSLTNHVAYRYYALKSYPHYCFFEEILNARSGVDKLAFFVYFTFKSWRRLFLAEFPRVYVNALNLYDILHVSIRPADKYSNPIIQFWNAFAFLSGNRLSDPIGFATLLLTVFSLAMWAISFVAIAIAFFCYFPLLYKIRGNLKEFVCHKIDKRISELLKRKVRERTQEARQAELHELEVNRKLQARNLAQGERGDPSITATAPPLGMKVRPTLPNVGDVDLDTESYSGSSYPEGISVREGSVANYQPYYGHPPSQMYQGAGYGVSPPQPPPQNMYQQQQQQAGYYLQGYQQPGPPPPPPSGPPPPSNHSGYQQSYRSQFSPLSNNGDGRSMSGEPLIR